MPASSLILRALAVPVLLSPLAHGQALPTARGGIALSVFGGVTGTYTGLAGSGGDGRNLGITAGADVGFRPHYGLFPTIEARGTYPVKDGQVDAQANVMAGLKLAHPFGRFSVYGDFLAGRQYIDYINGYIDQTGTLLYQRTVGSIFSPGAGVDVDLTPSFAFKADFQYQRLATPAVPAGHLNAKAGTIAVVYRFGFNRGFPRR